MSEEEFTDRAWPGEWGIPLNPERDGWHWLQEGEWPPLSVRWFSADQAWDGRVVGHGVWKYLGPCYEPHEVAAKEADAMKVMRERIAEFMEAAATERKAEADKEGGSHASYMLDDESALLLAMAKDVRNIPLASPNQALLSIIEEKAVKEHRRKVRRMVKVYLVGRPPAIDSFLEALRINGYDV